MSSDDLSDLIDLAAGRLADGEPNDWNALAGRVSSDEERKQLDILRILEALADVHRSSDGSANQSAGIVPNRTPSTPPPGDWAGETWGRYKLLDEVGAGSFGSVYRAWDPDLECEIAIKILRGDADEQLKERLLREGRALARVRDPNVVKVLGVESYGDRVGLCMEFIHGETLDEVLKSHGTLNAREATLVGQDVCRALAAVHRAKFVHRDVKSRNIMRERAGRIVLMDFGTGRDVKTLERADGRVNVAGTPLYMAPEVIAGQQATFCSDVYSVGVLLYYLTTGSYPVEGRTLDDIRAAHMIGRRTPISERRSDLPTSFIGVVNSALVPQPQQRYQSAGELLEALAAINTPDPRRWTVAIVAAGLAAVLGTVIGLGATSSSYFNRTFGRSEFTDEGISQWLTSGRQSLVAPVVLFAFTLLSLALITVCRRFLLSISPKARRFEEDLYARILKWKLDDLENLSACALLVSVTVLVGAWWYFSSLLGALMITDVSTVPASQLALLSPQFKSFQQTYRASFIWVTITSLMVWYLPLRLASMRRARLNRGLLAGGAVVALLAILLLDFPYRMLTKNTFRAAQWQGARCYVLGERGDEDLLFCPRLDPRRQIVPRGEKGLELLGFEEDIFTQFANIK